MDFRYLLNFTSNELSSYNMNEFTFFREPAKIFYMNGFSISFAANALVYCNPKKITDTFEYESFELAFFNDRNKHSFIDLKNHEDFKAFPKIKELDEYFNVQIYAYVPVPLIQELFDYIDSIYNRVVFDIIGDSNEML